MKMALPLAFVLGAAAVFAAGDGYDPPAVEYKNMPYETDAHVRAHPLPAFRLGAGAVRVGPGPGGGTTTTRAPRRRS